jgi:Tfp pilus assembly protein PilF
VPIGLSADYSFTQIPVLDSWHDPRLSLAALLAVATIAATALAWRRHRLAATLVLLFVLLWLPVSNTLVLIGTIMGERLMYLPSIAFALLVGALVRQLTPGTDRLSPRLMTGAAAVAVVHIGLAMSRNVEWRTQEALFRATVVRSPRSVKAHFNYGVELQAHGRSEDAARHFHAALALAPDYPEANNALGTVLLAAQDLAGAEARFRAALSTEPGFARAWLNLGTALFRAGRDSEARPALQRALQLDDRLVIAHATLGALAERAHDRDGAIDHYQTAYGLAPDFEGLGPHLAELLLAAGRGDQARIVLTEVERRRSQARPSTTSPP